MDRIIKLFLRKFTFTEKSLFTNFFTMKIWSHTVCKITYVHMYVNMYYHILAIAIDSHLNIYICTYIGVCTHVDAYNTVAIMYR